MKVLAILLVCAVAAVQSRAPTDVAHHTTNDAARDTPAILGEAPWFVHLRKATMLSGDLRTCAGSLISPFFVLTSGDCVSDARFVWARLGLINVFTPNLVVESTNIRMHPSYGNLFGESNVALVGFNNAVATTNNIRPIALGSGRPATGKFCHFGEDSDGEPGTVLVCFQGTLSDASLFSNEIHIDSNDGVASLYDIGAPLTNANNQQIGILTHAPGWLETNEGTFNRPENYIDWIRSEANI